jgi:hypothetical protein
LLVGHLAVAPWLLLLISRFLLRLLLSGLPHTAGHFSEGRSAP